MRRASPSSPEAGHPAPGEGAGMPEQGAGRAKEQSTPPIGTHDQGGDQTGLTPGEHAGTPPKEDPGPN